MTAPPPRQPTVYRVSRWIVSVLLKLLCRARGYGADHVPREGACIIAANHASYLDPPLLAATIPHRQIRFMARDSLFRKRVANWFLHAAGVIPVARDRGDVAAMRAVLRTLEDGHVAALFPEGTRTYDGNLQPAKGGIGFLIAKAAVDVVPVYLDGTFAALPRKATRLRLAPVRAFVGPPLRAAELAALGKGKQAYAQISDLVMSRIADLRPPAEESKRAP